MDRLDAMRLFVRVIDRRSFTAAAADLGIPRSTATEAIRRLERDLGSRLMERTTRHVAPTPDGNAYYRRCLSILADIDEAEGALRGGHIPGAANVPWSKEAAHDSTFRPRDELEQLYGSEAGLSPDDDVVVYCRIGERSSHTWFVLKYLLGYNDVRNYDGSWTEWGNMVGAPVERGAAQAAKA